MMQLARLVGRVAAFAAVAAIAGALALPANAQSFPDPKDEAKLYENAKKEGTVVWYGGAPLEPMKAMALDFEAKYPGVRVEILRMVGVAQYQRFMQETEAKQYIADVLHIGDRPSMVDLINRGHVVEWKVPTFDRFPEGARIKTHSYVAYTIDGAIAYNPTKVTPEEVKILASDWKGLLDPRFKGRMATSIQRSGGTNANIQMFTSPQLKDRYGWDFLKALAAQKPTLYNDVIIPTNRVVAGEHDISFFPSEGNMYVFYQNGAPLRWVHPKPTSVFGNTWFGVSKYAPHGNAARLFVNWVMSEDGAKSVQLKYGGITTLIGYPDQRPVTKEAWYMPVTEQFDVDWDRWEKEAVKNFTEWERLLKASQ